MPRDPTSGDLALECAVHGELVRETEAIAVAADLESYRLALLAALDVAHRQATEIGRLMARLADLRAQLRAVLESTPGSGRRAA